MGAKLERRYDQNVTMEKRGGSASLAGAFADASMIDGHKRLCRLSNPGS
jgi:hypothetical protein